MTGAQFAIAAGCEAKWILNSAALLRKRVRRTPADAQWWGLVRMLSETLRLPLQTAADAATSALEPNQKTRPTVAVMDPSGSVSLSVDLPRYQSIVLANLSRALVHETPRRRGRPPRSSRESPLDSARCYGIDLGLVRAALKRTPADRLEMLEANAAFIRGMKRRAA
jgi:hypothetical protein